MQTEKMIMKDEWSVDTPAVKAAQRLYDQGCTSSKLLDHEDYFTDMPNFVFTATLNALRDLERGQSPVLSYVQGLIKNKK